MSAGKKLAKRLAVKTGRPAGSSHDRRVARRKSERQERERWVEPVHKPPLNQPVDTWDDLPF